LQEVQLTNQTVNCTAPVDLCKASY